MSEGQRSRRATVLRCATLAASLALLVANVAFGQVLYGTVVGNVKDVSGASVPGATITVTNVQTNQSREAVTNESGSYWVSNLLAGKYTVRVGLTGFKEFSQTDVEVTLNRALLLRKGDLQLEEAIKVIKSKAGKGKAPPN